MAGNRASLSISTPNESWLQAQIDSGEFASRSEVVNDLIRKARKKDREAEYIRTKLLASEKSLEEHGWVKETPNEMLIGFKERARHDGKI
ncbi:MAG: CopG family transcriptional regulator [Candidatus Thiodiazotropha taylori]|nr:CopG family transcriptional regulator [Candidatus Thiodiazotropha taylori]MCG8043347.1 CopG family transcriptional regulator [Candidatus Thiodiazotropha taylori]MCG8056448.1 CopG family transcriptional regulator [Candidatus Thiodiazotropha taylori]MCW4240026.1 CopG family transcriptional regulator [Candidatus Thiodiazotropha taylori]MCW4318279.1 CopG family transcriptional regulator [Candidatus Thiodiazotropha taylori]